MQQDELARLFANNLSLTQPVEPATLVVEQSFQQAQEETTAQPQPITYISQHYHHSTHIAPKAHSAPTSTAIDASDLEAIFLRNSVDPTSLFPSQINLFQNADDDQRLRLLELWRISPPSYGGHGLAQELGTWPETSLQQEEVMAKLRYERLMDERQRQQEQGMKDEMDRQPPAVQTVSSLLSSPESTVSHAEPYILSGYEALAKRDYEQQIDSLRETTKYNQATDPVYKASMGLWEDGGRQGMENRYGAFAAMREYGMPLIACGMDDEMVM